MTVTALACIVALGAAAVACGQWARARRLARLVAYYRAVIDERTPDARHDFARRSA